MRTYLSGFIHVPQVARARRPVHHLAETDDRTLRDIGLRRTDLYAVREFRRSRIAQRLLSSARPCAFAAFKGVHPASCC